MAEITECYEILGCSYGESLGSVKKKFINLSLIHHPDKGGEKEFFDVICNSYKTIRRIRRNELFPEENINYIIDEDFHNDTVISKEEFTKMVKEIEANLSAGYNDYNHNVESVKESVYDPFDIHKVSDEFCSFTGTVKSFQDSEGINYSGRDTDSKQYYGLVEYGKFGIKNDNKGGLEGYDLGCVFSGLSVDPPPRDDNFDEVDYDKILNDVLLSRDNQLGSIIDGYEKSIDNFDKFFEEEHTRYLLECQFESNSNKILSRLNIGN